MALLGGPAEEVGGPRRIGRCRRRVFRHGPSQRIGRVDVAIGGRLLQPGARLDQIALNALAAEVERAEIELGPAVALRRGLLEEFDGTGRIAGNAGVAVDEDESQSMLAFGRARVGGALDQLEAFGLGAAVEQDGAQPGISIGIRRPSERSARSAVAVSPWR